MADAKALVTRRHRLDAYVALYPANENDVPQSIMEWAESGQFTERRADSVRLPTLAQALATAEQRGLDLGRADAAIDLLARAAMAAGNRLRFVEQNGKVLLQSGGCEALGATPTAAVVAMCEQLGLLPAPPKVTP